MLDRLLTTMLWLINPNIELSLSTIISAHSQGLLIKWDLFDKFFKTVEEMKKEGTVSDEQINTLFYNNYITEELTHYRDEDIKLFPPSLIHEKIESASLLKKKATTEQERIKRENEKLIQEQEILKQNYVKIEKENDKIFENIKNQTHSIFLFMRALVLFIFVGASILLILTREQIWLLIITVPVAFITLCGHLFGSISPKIDALEDTVSTWRFSRLKQ